jgi:hypothetical protein
MLLGHAHPEVMLALPGFYVAGVKPCDRRPVNIPQVPGSPLLTVTP